MSVISAIAVMAIACGSEGPTKSSRQARDGRVYVRNESSELSLKVTLRYGEQVRTVTLAPGERKEITEEVIKGGTQITLVMDAFVPPPANITIQSDPTTLKYEIDGALTIVSTSTSTWARCMEYERV